MKEAGGRLKYVPPVSFFDNMVCYCNVDRQAGRPLSNLALNLKKRLLMKHVTFSVTFDT